MAGEIVVTPKGYTENPDLLPVPASERAKGYNWWTFTMMMFSMNTCIPMFFLGPIGGGLGLDVWQVLIGAFIGNLAACIVMWLNGVVGVSMPLPTLYNSESPSGSKDPDSDHLEGLAGTVWFGVEAWAGSLPS
jgi:NCS1 family nucleobase:cation symporter-1